MQGTLFEKSNNFRAVLESEFIQRQAIDPQFSLRRFAAELTMSPSALSEILNGKHGLSRRGATKVAARLGYDAANSAAFVDLVARTCGRRSKERAIAEARVNARNLSVKRLSEDALKFVTEWYHHAILVLPAVASAAMGPSAIAMRYGLSVEIAQGALRRLIRLGLLRKVQGRLVPSDQHFATTDDVPSHAIKQCNAQILRRALQAVVRQRVEEREIASMVMAIRREDIPRAKEMLKEFRRKFCQDLEVSQGADHVYALSLAFFNLDESL